MIKAGALAAECVDETLERAWRGGWERCEEWECSCEGNQRCSSLGDEGCVAFEVQPEQPPDAQRNVAGGVTGVQTVNEARHSEDGALDVGLDIDAQCALDFDETSSIDRSPFPAAVVPDNLPDDQV
jgi:hypothetical protein